LNYLEGTVVPEEPSKTISVQLIHDVKIKFTESDENT